MYTLHDDTYNLPIRIWSYECIRMPHRQTDRQTDRQTNRQTDKQTDRQAGRQAGRQMVSLKYP